MRYPNLYLIGAPRAGTTTLHALLARSGEIFSAHIKEPAYFTFRGAETLDHEDRPVRTFDYQRDAEAYLDLYAGWRRQRYAIDASTYYLATPGAAEEIRACAPGAKAIAILREPLSRAYSHYLMEVRDGWVAGDFVPALQREIGELHRAFREIAGHYAFIRQSRYLAGLQAFHAAFGPDGLRVYRFEDLSGAEPAVLADLARFLGIDLAGLGGSVEVRNSFSVDRFPALSRALNSYRQSDLRLAVNRLTPRPLRDGVRLALTRIRQVPAEKPPFPEAAKDLLRAHLGEDYAQALRFARETGILFEAAGSGPTGRPGMEEG